MSPPRDTGRVPAKQAGGVLYASAASGPLCLRGPPRDTGRVPAKQAGGVLTRQERPHLSSCVVLFIAGQGELPMTYRSTAALVFFALALAGYSLLIDRERPTTSEAEDRARALLPAKKDDVIALTATRGDQSIRLVREGGRWSVTAP